MTCFSATMTTSTMQVVSTSMDTMAETATTHFSTSSTPEKAARWAGYEEADGVIEIVKFLQCSWYLIDHVAITTAGHARAAGCSAAPGGDNLNYVFLRRSIVQVREKIRIQKNCEKIISEKIKAKKWKEAWLRCTAHALFCGEWSPFCQSQFYFCEHYFCSYRF